MGAPLIRTAAAPVTFTKRAVEIVAVPFDEPTRISPDLVEAFPRTVRVEPLRAQIPALLHHDDRQPFGHVELAGPDSRGLLAVLHAARTRAGDEALELAAAGVLYPSIGFSAIEDREVRGVVWRHAITLWEISLVTFQAYPGADVLSVRDATHVPPTPNLHAALAMENIRKHTRKESPHD
jgi:HK97 family phage prohead protease